MKCTIEHAGGDRQGAQALEAHAVPGRPGPRRARHPLAPLPPRPLPRLPQGRPGGPRALRARGEAQAHRDHRRRYGDGGAAVRRTPGRVAGAGLVVGGRRHLARPRRCRTGPSGSSSGRSRPRSTRSSEYLEKRADQARRRGAGLRGPRVLRDRAGAGRAVRAPSALDVRPGVSSVATAFARLGLPWDDAVVVSAHGRDLRTAVERLPGASQGGGADRARRRARRAGRRARVPARRRACSSWRRALGDPEHERVERVTPAEAAARDWGRR